MFSLKVGKKTNNLMSSVGVYLLFRSFSKVNIVNLQFGHFNQDPPESWICKSATRPYGTSSLDLAYTHQQ